MSTDLFAEIEAADVRTTFQCLARGCEGCTVCRPDLFEQFRKRLVDKTAKTHKKPVDKTLDLHKSAPAEPHASHTRPRAFAACNLTVLALDLGTTTGFAIAPRGKPVRSGSFRLDPAKVGGNGRRWIAFREWLTATAREVGGVQVVYVEDVRRHVSNLSARVYCGYLAMLEAWCAANNVRLEGVGVGTIKKHFTGDGRAKKGAMIGEARRRGFNPTDDNEADALAILAYGVKQEA